ALLEHPSERIQENVAGAIRNLVINDHNKVAIRECGGIETILAKLNHSWKELNNAVTAATAAASGASASSAAAAAAAAQAAVAALPSTSFAISIMDKLISTIWILTVTPENCQRLQPALSLLLAFASSTILPVSVREKVVGTLRHCSR